MALKDIRPPTPQMKDNELHQWRERIYKALLELSDALGVDGGGGVSFDHDDLDNNGGDGAHEAITAHIASHIAHGSGSDIIGQADIVALIQAAIAAISGLEHGNQVDNPTSAHGVTEIIGASEAQVITNKRIVARIKVLVTETFFQVNDDYDVVFASQASTIIQLPQGYKNQGKVVRVVNSAPGNIALMTIPGDYIMGESVQTIPPRSSVTLVSSGVEWGIV